MLSKKIKFSSSLKDIVPNPCPSINYIPQAYKEMENYFLKKSRNNKTVKMCAPFLDAYNMGYIIPFPTDIFCYYDNEDKVMKFEINKFFEDKFFDLVGVQGHANYQVSESLRYNRRTIDGVFKFSNPWLIETPPGYSCIFTQPFNQNLPFKIIEGVVDTDSFNMVINFPFYWTEDSAKQVLIKKGDPMVQVIPFKREEWNSNIKIVTEKQNKKIKKTNMIWATIFENVYKKLSWKKKRFK